MDNDTGLPRVLLVHADKAMRELLKLHLACEGYDVVVKDDAVDAGREALRRPPKLVLLDVNMPYMGDVEFVTVLADDPELALIPVLFLTVRREVRERVERLGGMACLTKPLDTEEFLAAVSRCIHSRGEYSVRAGVRPPFHAAA